MALRSFVSAVTKSKLKDAYSDYNTHVKVVVSRLSITKAGICTTILLIYHSYQKYKKVSKMNKTAVTN